MRFFAHFLNALLLFTTFNTLALDNVKDYQKTLLNEPVTLLDLMVFDAQLDLNDYIRNDPFTRLDRYETSLLDFEYLIKPSEDRDEGVALNTFLLIGNVNFDYGKGKFVYNLEKTWSPSYHLRFIFNDFEFERESFERNGLVKISQKNFASYCKRALISVAASSEIELKTHSGYSTPNTRKLPENAYASVRNDTHYIFTLKLGRYHTHNIMSVKCSASKNDISKQEPIIEFEFIGDWHLLDDILEKEAVSIGLIKKKKEIIKLN